MSVSVTQPNHIDVCSLNVKRPFVLPGFNENQTVSTEFSKNQTVLTEFKKTQTVSTEFRRKEALGKPSSRWEDSIKMDLREVVCGMDCIELAQGRNGWQAVVNAVRLACQEGLCSM